MDRKLQFRRKSKVAFNVEQQKPPEKIIELIGEENEIYCEKLRDEDESTEDGTKKLERKLRKKKKVKRPVNINLELVISDDKE